MRLGPFEITAATRTLAPASVTEPKGATGTVSQDGYIIREEWNPELRGIEGLKIFRKMRKGDASVRETEQHIFAPIKNATWGIEPYSDEPEDLEVSAAVQAMYFKWADHPFQQHLHQALTHTSMGFQVFEDGLNVVEDEVEYDDPATGDTVTVPARQYVTIARFEQRLPETIIRWRRRNGRLASVVQQAYKDGEYGEFEMPVERLTIFTNEQEGDDYEGVPTLRSAYPAWFLKRMIERSAGASVERHGMGVWVIYPPSSAADDDTIKDRLEEIFSAVGLGDSPYVIAPGPKQATDRDGYVIELVSPQGQLPDFVKLLEYLRGEIKGNLLARFSELGHGSVGARATGDVQSQVWYAALHAVATYIADVHNKGPIQRFVRANFGIERFPRLTVEDIETRSLEEYAKAVSLIQSTDPGQTDTAWRAWVRRSVDAPDADETEEEPVVEEEPSPPEDMPSKPDAEDNQPPEPK